MIKLSKLVTVAVLIFNLPTSSFANFNAGWTVQLKESDQTTVNKWKDLSGQTVKDIQENKQKWKIVKVPDFAMQESTIVSINHNGEYFINSLGEDNSEVSKGEKQSLGVIAGRVRARLEIYPSMKVFVRGDANVAYGSVVSLMSFLQKNGVDEIRLISTIDKTRDKRLAELKRAEKRVENERYKVQQRLKKLKAKVKQEKQAKAKAEKNRKDAEQKIKLALKKKRLPEKKAKEAEASKFEKKQHTQSLKKEIKTEENQEDILNELKANYVNQIASRVKEKWRYQGAKDDWGCDVYILQDINGKVQTVNLQSCNVENNAKSKAFKDAIERAVYKASPLPKAPIESVFDSEITFHFKVN